MRGLIIVALIGLAPPLEGQRIESLRTGVERPIPALSRAAARTFAPGVIVEPPRDELSFTAMTASGLLFAAAGLAAGGYTGSRWQCDTDDGDWCQLGGAILGGVLIETVMTPLGVHLVHKKGSLRRELLVAGAISLVGFAAVAPVPIPGIFLLPFALPPLHIVSTILIERRAALRELEGR